MILNSLIEYYHRLNTDPKNSIAPYGFTREKIHFAVVLNPDGSLRGSELEDLRETLPDPKTERSRIRPRVMTVPDRGGRSGTGVKPNFLWDNTGYVLGRDDKGKPERAEKMFAAFVELHQRLARQVDDADIKVLCRFLEAWRPEFAEDLCNWEEAAGTNVVFRVHRPGQLKFVHEGSAYRDQWIQFRSEETDTITGISLTSGDREQLARLHNSIRGVQGTNTTGAVIVGFNADAFTSYRKSQSYNAPVGLLDAFRYTTALNLLLADVRHRIRIGDSTVVYWADEPTVLEDAFGEIVADGRAEDDSTRERVRGFVQALRQGRRHAGLADDQVGFHILGLSPNASRISIRFWLSGTVREFVERLSSHFADLEMIGIGEDSAPLSINGLLRETAREPKEIAPHLAGEVARAILSGGPYPQALYQAVLRRIRADRVINSTRAAILKACLLRRSRILNRIRDLSVTLNMNHPDPAYHLGRLFAALERTQEDALGRGLNKTIRDGFYSSASTTPASVFPRLIKLHQHHIGKMDNQGLKVNRDRLVQEIVSHFKGMFPMHLSLEEQGMFHIGYYHQRQAFFTKRRETSNEEAAS